MVVWKETQAHGGLIGGIGDALGYPASWDGGFSTMGTLHKPGLVLHLLHDS